MNLADVSQWRPKADIDNDRPVAAFGGNADNKYSAGAFRLFDPRQDPWEIDRPGDCSSLGRVLIN
jgi:hypothetical protein